MLLAALQYSYRSAAETEAALASVRASREQAAQYVPLGVLFVLLAVIMVGAQIKLFSIDKTLKAILKSQDSASA